MARDRCPGRLEKTEKNANAQLPRRQAHPTTLEPHGCVRGLLEDLKKNQNASKAKCPFRYDQARALKGPRKHGLVRGHLKLLCTGSAPDYCDLDARSRPESNAIEFSCEKARKSLS